MGRLGRGPASLPLREVSDERGSPRSLTELLVEADEEETDEEYGCALWRLLLLTVSRMDGGDAGEKDIVGATRTRMRSLEYFKPPLGLGLVLGGVRGPQISIPIKIKILASLPGSDPRQSPSG